VGVNLGLSHKGKAEENIWTYERGNNGKLEKIADQWTL
jgi:hypothetical protein